MNNNRYEVVVQDYKENASVVYKVVIFLLILIITILSTFSIYRVSNDNTTITQQEDKYIELQQDYSTLNNNIVQQQTTYNALKLEYEEYKAEHNNLNCNNGHRYYYTHTGNCEVGGFDIYTCAVCGNCIKIKYNTHEHLWDNTTHKCVRNDNDQIVISNLNYLMVICGSTASIWNQDDTGILTAGIDIESSEIAYYSSYDLFGDDYVNNYLSFSDTFNTLQIETVVVNEGIKQITGNTFRNCTTLNSVIFNNDLEYIGPYAFDNTNIKTFELPSSIKGLGEDALNPYKIEKLITLPSDNNTDVAFVSLCCFHYLNNDNLETLQNMNYYKRNGKYDNLKYAEFYAPTYIGCMGFRDCNNLKTVIFHENNSYIESWAFQGCTSLSILDLTGVTYIGEVAIQCCESLLEIYIPSTLVGMDHWVFDGSYNLKYIYIEHESKPSGWHNEWPGTIGFTYTPKTPTAANSKRTRKEVVTEIHWGCTKDNLNGSKTHYFIHTNDNYYIDENNEKYETYDKNKRVR